MIGAVSELRAVDSLQHPPPPVLARAPPDSPPSQCSQCARPPSERTDPPRLSQPARRGRPCSNGKLVDNFSHESDVTSLQGPFTSRPYKTPFYFYYCVPRKIRRGILFQIHVEYSPSGRLLVSALAVYATAFRPMFPYISSGRSA